jgi:glutamate-5-semialdehyde dehydrogenase
MNIKESASHAKSASIKLAAAGSEEKNRALKEIAEAIAAKEADIINANNRDIERSEKEDLPLPLLKRLKFDAGKIGEVIEGIESLIKIPDPVGEIIEATELSEGLELNKVSCPIGVIGVIFESRPDALVQISTLCLKSGNSVMLKGGSEASETNRILARIIAEAAETAGVPAGWIQLLETRSDVNEMLGMDEFIDLIIPRGSNEFVKYIMDNSNIPVLGHADGICHCYIDEGADIDMAVKVAVDSKTQYIAACNTLETLLVHRGIAGRVLPLLKEKMDEAGIELLGCEKSLKIIDISPATEDDWKTEYLDYKLSVKIVDDMDKAIEHINRYGSGHTDTIVTNDSRKAGFFMELVDSGCVFWNCSTRFSDGFRFGLGAEVGISTNKIHARGPVGLPGLLIYKYRLSGEGHTVSEFSDGSRKYTHKKIEKP